jgi:hypothetical protein
MTIEEEFLLALRAMDHRSKLFLLRAAKNQASRCPVVPAAKLRLASSDLGGGPLIGTLSHTKNVILTLISRPPEKV